MSNAGSVIFKPLVVVSPVEAFVLGEFGSGLQLWHPQLESFSEARVTEDGLRPR